ncbi:MAG TPA: DUF1343 domain-containing protein [Bacteroidales bacterium]|nr:DUF1343 domain-containing protein [Bacteroidales bacterium]HOX76323.1 DUF1343 domain-containing protein [Bacteroidales bacterium]
MITFRIVIITLILGLPWVTLCCQPVETGLDVLVRDNFRILKRKKVGLITNPTGVDRNLRSTVDILYNAPGVTLTALYGPEHGVRGEFTAGEIIGSAKDPATGLPVFSLYGETRKPSKEMLRGIDILVYDIQDIGSRSYTYISTLGLAIEAAAENNIPFVVLDRPNPLGGIRMEGPLVEPGFVSFVSQYSVPYIHGLTVGELAGYLNEEGLLRNGIKCRLEVIKMKGWKREMIFEETGLPWVPSSPHMPHAQTALFYPATGILGELYTVSIGVGYTLPFQLFAAEWINADSLAAGLNSLSLPGVKFRPVHFKPYYSVSQGKMIHGVQIHLTDPEIAPLTLLQFYFLQEAHKLWPDKDAFSLCDPSRLEMFDKVCGTDKVRTEFLKTWQVRSILDLWNKDIPAFRKKAERYFLY